MCVLQKIKKVNYQKKQGEITKITPNLRLLKDSSNNSNSIEKTKRVGKKNKSNKKKNVPVNEIFEYQPEETLPINDLKYIRKVGK